MSNIDPTKPIAGTPTTASVRDNFAAADAHIDNFEARLAALEAVYLPAVAPTWNTGDGGAGINLQNGGRDAYETRGNWTAVRAHAPKSSGKHYAELYFGGNWSSGNAAGIATDTTAAGAPMNTRLGLFPESYGHFSTHSGTGSTTNQANGSGSTTDPAPSIVSGAVLGYGLDCDNHLLFIFQNGILIQTFTGLEAAPFYLCCSPYDFAAFTRIQQEPIYLPPSFQSWTP